MHHQVRWPLAKALKMLGKMPNWMATLLRVGPGMVLSARSQRAIVQRFDAIGLVEHLVGDAELTDIVQQAGAALRGALSLWRGAPWGELGDQDALRTILHQFIDSEETIEWCEFLGTLGIQPFGLKSFAVLTAQRIGTLRIGWFGYVLYQDAPLEFTVSGMINQPSKLGLYIWLTINSLLVFALDVFLFRSVVAPRRVPAVGLEDVVEDRQDV